jgi:hypothetical protein
MKYSPDHARTLEPLLPQYHRQSSLTRLLPLVLVLSSCSVQPGPDAPAPTDKVHLPPLAPLPNSWPSAALLPPNDCRPGAVLTQQWPRYLAGVATATIDNRCVTGQSPTHVTVRFQPTNTSAVVAELPNGTAVRLDCQTAGEAMHDTRSPAENPIWLGISFQDPASSHLGRGFLNAASAGWLAVPLPTDVAPCTSQ